MEHFVWMIEWRLDFFSGDEAPHIYHIACLEEANGKNITISIYLPLLHDGRYLVYSPKENLYSWEETYPLKIFQCPCSLLRTNKILEGRTVIFLN